jgi:hypothetical protein
MLGYSLDTLQIARKVFSESNSIAKPNNKKFSTLYQYFTGSELEGNHWALDDVKALYVVFRKAVIWNCRAFQVNDSDSNIDSASSPGEVGNTDVEDLFPLGDFWSMDHGGF